MAGLSANQRVQTAEQKAERREQEAQEKAKAAEGKFNAVQQQAKKYRQEAKVAQQQAGKYRQETSTLKRQNQEVQRVLINNQQQLNQQKNRLLQQKQQLAAATQQQQQIQTELDRKSEEVNQAIQERKTALRERNLAREERQALEEEIVVVQLLSQDLASKLDRQGLTEARGEALQYAGLYFSIDRDKPQLKAAKQAMLHAAIAQAYQALYEQQQQDREEEPSAEFLNKAQQAIDLSLKWLSKTEDTSSPEALQIRAFAHAVHGRLLARQAATAVEDCNPERSALPRHDLRHPCIRFAPTEPYQNALKSTKIAFEILKSHPQQTDPFDPELPRILSARMLESIHQQLMALLYDANQSTVLEQTRTQLTEHYLKELDKQLHERKWREADLTTGKVMLLVAKHERDQRFTTDSLNQFDCKRLGEIDRHWAKHNEGRFGFSVQAAILKKEGWQPGDVPDETWFAFYEKVGWWNRDRNRDWSVSAFHFNWTQPDKVEQGYLPFLVGLWWLDGGSFGWVVSLLPRFVKCNL